MNARSLLSRLSLGFPLGLAALLGSGACYTGATIGETEGPDAGAPPIATATPIGANSGLPCDVAKVVSDSCASCHGARPTGGATASLVTVEGFTAPSTANPQQTVGQLAVVRMRNAKDPMPTLGLLPEADVAIVDNWVKAGMPRGECAPIATKADPFFDNVVECSSNSRWTRGDRGSSSMHPGVACIDCHKRKRAPTYTVAGTVYATGHEVDDCSGTASGPKVVLSDGTGKVLATLSVNSAGNFYSTVRLPASYTVKIVQGSKERAMQATPSSGDCNSCHTQDGAEGAPGRIALPE